MHTFGALRDFLWCVCVPRQIKAFLKSPEGASEGLDLRSGDFSRCASRGEQFATLRHQFDCEWPNIGLQIDFADAANPTPTQKRKL